MGEEAKPDQNNKQETKPEEKNEHQDKTTKENVVNVEPKPPLPFVLSIDLHCVGCARKIQRSLLKIRGVEGVMMDMGLNQVTIKGVVEPQAVCTKIMKTTKRKAMVLSPLPAAEGEPIPDVVASQVSGLTTVELNVNMHCEACALHLKRKILKMKGVRTAETDLNGGKVTVTGTMDGNKLVDYVYRRTKKQAKIVPQPSKPAEEPKKEEDKPAAAGDPDPKPEDKEGEPAPDGAHDTPPVEEKKEEQKDAVGEEPPKGTAEDNKNDNDVADGIDQQMAQRMTYYHYQPLYVIERIPPPQLFSDENPNACRIV